MTAIAQVMDKKLKQWPPATAHKIERLVSEAIALADAGVHPRKPSRASSRSVAQDPLFADGAVWKGSVPKDSAANHDRYLYDKGE